MPIEFSMARYNDIDTGNCSLNFNSCTTCRQSTFFFLGSGGAPSSHHTSMFSFPVAELVVVGVLIGLGLVIAVGFFIFNIVWRQNK